MIQFKEITKENLWTIMRLDVEEGQQNYVAPNSMSIAEAAYHPEYTPLAIYDDEKAVGFIMYGIDKEDPNWLDTFWLIRLMIDKNYQKKGYGRKAMALFLEDMRTRNVPSIYLGVNVENGTTKRFYESFGFISTNRVEGHEEIMRLTF